MVGIFLAKVETAVPTEALQPLSIPPSDPSRNYYYSFLFGDESGGARFKGSDRGGNPVTSTKQNQILLRNFLL
jgi:hypothetical protein